MSRDSRFDKLEIPRVQRTADTAESRLGRFSPDADGARPAQTHSAEAAPAEQAPLARFQEDGAAGLHLDREALSRLPYRRCPACHRDSSKWDTACIYCRTPLDSPEAIAFNLQALAELDAQRAAESEAIETTRRAEVVQRANEQAEVILGNERARTSERRVSQRLGAVAVGLVCFSVMWVAPWYVIKLFAFVGFVLSTAVAVPGEMWRRLTQTERD